ncbi:NCS2 family permease [Sphaerobacter thermophilus]|uniref:NCS2 family permease n=1 Tax=Sphaerobacter thermophilus TaxID=2057 RepID=UPI0039C1811B
MSQQTVATRQEPGTEGFLDRFFHLKEFGTTVPTEVMAGLTTFMVMAYILFVNPIILGNPDLPDQFPIRATATATALVAGVMTIIMGLATNRAYAIAPGMGLNAIVAFQLVGSMGLTMPQAMGVIVAEGLVITALVLLGIRQAVFNAIPTELKKAISVGIGLFILFIGLVNGGIVVADPATLVALGDLRGAPVFVTAFGLALTIALMARNVRGAILWGILGSTVAAIIAKAVTGTDAFAPGVAELPSQWIATPDFGTIGQFSFGFIAELGVLTAILVVFALMLSDFFDTMGTLIGVGSQAGYLNEKGELPQAQRALVVDSLAAVAGGAAGTSSATTYIESAAGVGVGGRTGLVAVVTGILFLLAMPLAPLVEVVPSQATAPALIIVGWMMMSVLSERETRTQDGRTIVGRAIDFANLEEGLPVVATMVMMPLTYNITNGIGAGFITWTLIKIFKGKFREVHPAMYIASLAFLVYFLRSYLGVEV